MKGPNMPETSVKDKNYNLVTAVQVSLHCDCAWEMGTFISDAEEAGDTELAEWFRKIQGKDRKAGEQGLRMLQDRLQIG